MMNFVLNDFWFQAAGGCLRDSYDIDTTGRDRGANTPGTLHVHVHLTRFCLILPSFLPHFTLVLASVLADLSV